MVEVSEELINKLVCPKCKKQVSLGVHQLVCQECKLTYPIKDGIPVMLIEEAQTLPNT